MNLQNQLSIDQISATNSLIAIQKMTAEELKDGGENISINYSSAQTPFGKILIASTSKGICYVAFFDNKSEAVMVLKSRFPNAHFMEFENEVHQEALKFFFLEENNRSNIQLHISGTPFQFEVWQALLEIPLGCLSTYGAIAKQIDRPGASRAVGSALGKNPVAFLIPCHRVVQASGNIGGYMWGANRKHRIIAAEAADIFGSEK